MAIVKASYTRSRQKIKATLRYIIHRPGREGERLTRTLFSRDGQPSKAQAYEFIDAQKGMTYFHLKLNFHPSREDKRKDLDLRAITKQTIATLQKRLNRPVRFLATEHNDHTALRHIHAIVLIKLGRGERIGRDDWKACRDEATAQALVERRALDVVRKFRSQRTIQRERMFADRDVRVSAARGRTNGVYGQSRIENKSCPDCGHKHPMVKLKDGRAYYCLTCGRVEEARPKLRLRQDHELSR